jgi:CHAD domain-containing protein
MAWIASNCATPLGMPDVTSTEQFAAEQARRQLDRLAVQIARTAKCAGAGEVHDLRVCIRKFMQVLVVLKPYFPAGESRRIRRRLKKIMAQAGDVRNCDVALRLLGEPSCRATSELIGHFRAQRNLAARTLAASLKRWVRRGSSSKWRSALERGTSSGGFPAEQVARQALPPMAKEYFKRGKGAAGANRPADELHAFRIAVKRLRYTLDLFAPLYGPSVNGLRQQLRGVQTLLGAINDCATVRRMVARRGESEKVRAALARRQRRETAEFRRHWAGVFSSAATVRLWVDRLRHVGNGAPAPRKPPARSMAARPAARRAAGA